MICTLRETGRKPHVFQPWDNRTPGTDRRGGVRWVQV